MNDFVLMGVYIAVFAGFLSLIGRLVYKAAKSEQR